MLEGWPVVSVVLVTCFSQKEVKGLKEYLSIFHGKQEEGEEGMSMSMSLCDE